MAFLGSFGSIISALTTSGNTSAIPSVISALGSLNSTSTQTNARLNQLAVLCNNPPAYANAAPAIITAIEGISGLPPSVLPLLETLRTAGDPLKIAQSIQAIEAMVSASTSIL
jgi:hypothetical protein